MGQNVRTLRPLGNFAGVETEEEPQLFDGSSLQRSAPCGGARTAAASPNMQQFQCSGSGCSSSFQARQDATCARRGRANATASSRHAAEMPTEEEASHAADDLASVVSGLSLGGRSLHPSIAGTAISIACSEVTIGAGDDLC